jgi:hypothetical protein
MMSQKEDTATVEIKKQQRASASEANMPGRDVTFARREASERDESKPNLA